VLSPGEFLAFTPQLHKVLLPAAAGLQVAYTGIDKRKVNVVVVVLIFSFIFC